MCILASIHGLVRRVARRTSTGWSRFMPRVDYGQDGHKKAPEYETYEDALAAINTFHIEPTLINHSGGGFHCYWVLNEPVNVSEIGLDALENVNRALLDWP